MAQASFSSAVSFEAEYVPTMQRFAFSNWTLGCFMVA
jgi:hypothetical protein